MIAAREPRSGTTRGRGRPAKVFALTEAGRDHFDQQYDDLAVQALRFLAETGGDDAVREFANRRVAFIEDRFDATLADNPHLSPTEALAQIFTDEGYAASVRELSVGDQLCQQHCPVSHVAHEFPQLCEAETEAIGRVLGRHVQRLATIAHGDGVCTTCIPGIQRKPTTQRTLARRTRTERQHDEHHRARWLDQGRAAEPRAEGSPRPLRVRLGRQRRRRCLGDPRPQRDRGPRHLREEERTAVDARPSPEGSQALPPQADADVGL